MEYLTNDKLVIVGAAGMIGSNMAQTALMMRLTPNICLYDPYGPALEGVAEELFHCAFEGANITFTTDIKEALTFGKDVRQYCPDVKHIVVIFNPADITGLITLLYSGLKPSQVTTLAALDSTRLQSELSKYLRLPAAEIVNCRTYGGHGEQMAVFASTCRVNGVALNDIIGTEQFPDQAWQELRTRVVQGGKNIIDLRGRSSFQSPSYLSIEMIAAAMGGKPFRWPAGTYVNNDRFSHIMMATETSITKDGVSCKPIEGTPAEMEELDKSYRHLCALRDEVIAMGVMPPIAEWHTLNPYLDKKTC